MSELLVLQSRDVQRICGVGEKAARELIKLVGVQVSPRRWVCTEDSLRRYLEGENQDTGET